jgi:hypothetical protein
MDFTSLHNQSLERAVHGRYLPAQLLEDVLTKHNASIIGKSVEGRPIYKIERGTGPVKVLMWSQMHGNESTTTKAVLDLLNLLSLDSDQGDEILQKVTLTIVPMLNPDGATKYTRFNASHIDLNRDFVSLSQPETRALMGLYHEIKPTFCFNLHDQRTIFGVGEPSRPAAISFLAPAFNQVCEVNKVRLESMRVIVHINKALSPYVHGCIGRFDDSFNLNCAGDRLTFLGTPTILVEAGHVHGDYQRELVRHHVFAALVAGLCALTKPLDVANIEDEYLQIPQNKIAFYDFAYNNVRICYDTTEIITNFAAHYEEVLIEGNIRFIAKIILLRPDELIAGHVTYDAKGARFKGPSGAFPIPGDIADFSLDDVKFANGVPV